MPLTLGSLFTGYGGLDLGIRSVLDTDLIWACDNNPWASRIITAHGWPNLGDITRVDWTKIEKVDLLAGGFPCQDLSYAGPRTGLSGKRSGLWTHMRDAISVLTPELVVIENVRGLLTADAHRPLEPCPRCLGHLIRPSLRALGALLGDLADLRYDAEWLSLRAADIGAPHRRTRTFLLAWPSNQPPAQPPRLRQER